MGCGETSYYFPRSASILSRQNWALGIGHWALGIGHQKKMLNYSKLP
ncbi:MAG: hypothetical protein F6J93_11080 [Oscillatoria sp. SIO1A7]|nr:hypothetical protein [Oscillatoria sp. SIO1A7]